MVKQDVETDTCTFCVFLMIVVFGWVLVTFWTVFIECLFYTYFGFDKSTLLHTFIVAIILTIVYIVFVNFSGQAGKDFKNNLVGLVPQFGAGETLHDIIGDSGR